MEKKELEKRTCHGCDGKGWLAGEDNLWICVLCKGTGMLSKTQVDIFFMGEKNT